MVSIAKWPSDYGRIWILARACPAKSGWPIKFLTKLAAHAWPEKWTACWLPVKWPAKSRQSTKHYPRPWSMAKYWLGSRWLQSKRAVCDRHETLCFIKGAVAIEEWGWRWAGGGGGGHKPFQELQVPTTTTFQVIGPTRLKSIQVHYLSTSSLVSSLLAQKTNQAIRHNKTPKLKGDLNKVLRLTYLLLKWKD